MCGSAENEKRDEPLQEVKSRNEEIKEQISTIDELFKKHFKVSRAPYRANMMDENVSVSGNTLKTEDELEEWELERLLLFYERTCAQYEDGNGVNSIISYCSPAFKSVAADWDSELKKRMAAQLNFIAHLESKNCKITIKGKENYEESKKALLDLKESETINNECKLFVTLMLYDGKNVWVTCKHPVGMCTTCAKVHVIGIDTCAYIPCAKCVPTDDDKQNIATFAGATTLAGRRRMKDSIQTGSLAAQNRGGLFWVASLVPLLVLFFIAFLFFRKRWNGAAPSNNSRPNNRRRAIDGAELIRV